MTPNTQNNAIDWEGSAILPFIYEIQPAQAVWASNLGIAAIIHYTYHLYFVKFGMERGHAVWVRNRAAKADPSQVAWLTGIVKDKVMYHSLLIQPSIVHQ